MSDWPTPGSQSLSSCICYSPEEQSTTVQALRIDQEVTYAHIRFEEGTRRGSEFDNGAVSDKKLRLLQISRKRPQDIHSYESNTSCETAKSSSSQVYHATIRMYNSLTAEPTTMRSTTSSSNTSTTDTRAFAKKEKHSFDEKLLRVHELDSQLA
eukprot:6216742-Amphidinium_carterae.1